MYAFHATALRYKLNKKSLSVNLKWAFKFSDYHYIRLQRFDLIKTECQIKEAKHCHWSTPYRIFSSVPFCLVSKWAHGHITFTFFIFILFASDIFCLPSYFATFNYIQFSWTGIPSPAQLRMRTSKRYHQNGTEAQVCIAGSVDNVCCRVPVSH